MQRYTVHGVAHESPPSTWPGQPVSAAERAAWKFVEDNKPEWDLVTINPPLVFGVSTCLHKQSNSTDFAC